MNRLMFLRLMILEPRDYFDASSSDRRRCYLHIGPRGTNRSVRLPGRLLDQIAGIHFDYQNDQIGLFSYYHGTFFRMNLLGQYKKVLV